MSDGERSGRVRLSDRKKFNDERNKELNNLIANRNTGTNRGDMVAPDIRGARHNYNTYSYDYFSGCQSKVFFGDIWVDDIVTIQYNIGQAKEPIYGYASQNYDAIMMGTILGQGSLTISFKETGYLNVIKALLDYQKQSVGNAKVNVANRLQNRQIGNLSANIRSVGQLSDQVNPGLTPGLVRQSETIEEILDNLKAKDISATGTIGRSNKHYSIEAGNRKVPTDLFKNTRGNIRDFEDIAQLLENSIWGDDNGRPFGTNMPKLLRADEFDYKYKDFRHTGIKSAIGDNYSDAFNILITFGDMTDHRAEHTILVLNDVHFTTQNLVVTPDGEPIGETYTFIFRDLNKSLATNNHSIKINPVKFDIGLGDDFITLSKLSDIDEIRSSFDENGKEQNIELVILSSFTDRWNKFTPQITINSENFINRDINQGNKEKGLVGQAAADIYSFPPFIPKAGFPFAEQLNDYVERLLEEYLIHNPDTSRHSKFAIRVKIRNDEFNYILQQQGTITSSSYKVISPAKTDYLAVDLVRREDFFDKVELLSDEEQLPEEGRSEHQSTIKDDAKKVPDELDFSKIEFYSDVPEEDDVGKIFRDREQTKVDETEKSPDVVDETEDSEDRYRTAIGINRALRQLKNDISDQKEETDLNEVLKEARKILTSATHDDLNRISKSILERVANRRYGVEDDDFNKLLDLVTETEELFDNFNVLTFHEDFKQVNETYESISPDVREGLLADIGIKEDDINDIRRISQRLGRIVEPTEDTELFLESVDGLLRDIYTLQRVDSSTDSTLIQDAVAGLVSDLGLDKRAIRIIRAGIIPNVENPSVEALSNLYTRVNSLTSETPGDETAIGQIIKHLGFDMEQLEPMIDRDLQLFADMKSGDFSIFDVGGKLLDFSNWTQPYLYNTGTTSTTEPKLAYTYGASPIISSLISKSVEGSFGIDITDESFNEFVKNTYKMESKKEPTVQDRTDLLFNILGYVDEQKDTKFYEVVSDRVRDEFELDITDEVQVNKLRTSLNNIYSGNLTLRNVNKLISSTQGLSEELQLYVLEPVLKDNNMSLSQFYNTIDAANEFVQGSSRIHPSIKGRMLDTNIDQLLEASKSILDNQFVSSTLDLISSASESVGIKIPELTIPDLSSLRSRNSQNQQSVVSTSSTQNTILPSVIQESVVEGVKKSIDKYKVDALSSITSIITGVPALVSTTASQIRTPDWTSVQLSSFMPDSIDIISLDNISTMTDKLIDDSKDIINNVNLAIGSQINNINPPKSATGEFQSIYNWVGPNIRIADTDEYDVPMIFNKTDNTSPTIERLTRIVTSPVSSAVYGSERQAVDMVIEVVGEDNRLKRVAVSPVEGTFLGYGTSGTTAFVEFTHGDERMVLAAMHQDPVPGLQYGNRVSPGQIIGINRNDVGITADFTGKHTHYELWEKYEINANRNPIGDEDLGQFLSDRFQEAGIYGPTAPMPLSKVSMGDSDFYVQAFRVTADTDAHAGRTPKIPGYAKSDVTIVKAQAYKSVVRNDDTVPLLVTAPFRPTDEFGPPLSRAAGFDSEKFPEYRGSGFDRGHLISSSFFADNSIIQQESFERINIVPQTQFTNRDLLPPLESRISEASRSTQGNLMIAPIYGDNPARIGNLPVPTSMAYILEISGQPPEAYIVPNITQEQFMKQKGLTEFNEELLQENWRKWYGVDMREINRQTGFIF